MAAEEEAALLGGATNEQQVVRVGDKVRRPRRSSGPAVDSLLGRLQVNHVEAPVPLGVDGQGRDRLTYVSEDVGIPPFPTWVLEDRAPISAARLLGKLHEATITMAVDSTVPWDTTFASGTGRVVAHNDVCPENTVFRAVAFINFDFAAPTDPVLDLAHLLRMWVPLGVTALFVEQSGSRLGRGPQSTRKEWNRGRKLQVALELSVSQSESFVRTRLDRPDLTAEYFARLPAELVEAAAAC